MKQQGKTYDIVVLQQFDPCTAQEVVWQAERKFIKDLRAAGHRLTNGNDGGAVVGSGRPTPGMTGRKHTQETRAKMSQVWFRTPEQIARQHDKLRGRKRSAETRAKMSATKRANPTPFAVRSAALKGKAAWNKGLPAWNKGLPKGTKKERDRNVDSHVPAKPGHIPADAS